MNRKENDIFFKICGSVPAEMAELAEKAEKAERKKAGYFYEI